MLCFQYTINLFKCIYESKFVFFLHYQLYIILFYYFPRARKDLQSHIGDVDAAAVPCGFGRTIGNKVTFSILVTNTSWFSSFFGPS